MSLNEYSWVVELKGMKAENVWTAINHVIRQPAWLPDGGGETTQELRRRSKATRSEPYRHELTAEVASLPTGLAERMPTQPGRTIAASPDGGDWPGT